MATIKTSKGRRRLSAPKKSSGKTKTKIIFRDRESGGSSGADKLYCWTAEGSNTNFYFISEFPMVGQECVIGSQYRSQINGDRATVTEVHEDSVTVSYSQGSIVTAILKRNQSNDIF